MRKKVVYKPINYNTFRCSGTLILLFLIFYLEPVSLFAQKVTFTPAPAGQAKHPDGPYRAITGAPPREIKNYAPSGSIQVNENPLYNTLHTGTAC